MAPTPAISVTRIPCASTEVPPDLRFDRFQHQNSFRKIARSRQYDRRTLPNERYWNGTAFEDPNTQVLFEAGFVSEGGVPFEFIDPELRDYAKTLKRSHHKKKAGGDA
jgi:hypothetical protein